MSQIDLNFDLTQITPENMPFVLTGALNSLSDQLNSDPQLYAVSPTAQQPTTNAGDILIGLNANGNINIRQDSGSGYIDLSQDTITQAIQFNGQNLSGSGIPTTDQFPNNGDWGFYTDITGPTVYIARNNNGTIQTSTLS